MVGTTGKVIGIEHIPELVELAKRNVARDQPNMQESGRIKFLRNNNAISLACQTLICNLVWTVGDGRKGYAPDQPYDAIHVGAAAPELPTEVICLKTI